MMVCNESLLGHVHKIYFICGSQRQEVHMDVVQCQSEESPIYARNIHVQLNQQDVDSSSIGEKLTNFIKKRKVSTILLHDGNLLCRTRVQLVYYVPFIHHC